MQVFLNILKFFPYVLTGVVAVEQVVGATVPGQTKKDIILGSIVAAAKVGEQTPNVNVQQISGLIDAVVGTLNASGVFNHHSSDTPKV